VRLFLRRGGTTWYCADIKKTYLYGVRLLILFPSGFMGSNPIRGVFLKMTKKEKIVISLGGSLIVPDKIDTKFLKQFKKTILKYTKTKQFIIIPGGGKTAREYIQAAEKTSNPERKQKDLLGIQAILLNAKLIQTIFKEKAHPKITLANKKTNTKKPIIIATGYEEKTSSDYETIKASNTYKSNTIINLTNVDYVYNKNPTKYKNALPIKQMTWEEYLKIIPKKFKAGMHVPFDPKASKYAKKTGKKTIIINGKKTKELNKVLNNKPFRGTIIQ